MRSSWTAEDIRSRGFDPATGARLVPRYPADPPASYGMADLVRDELVSKISSKCLVAPLSSSARSRLTPEQRLQVECIEQLRPRLVAGAKLIAINGELPGGTKLFRLWQAVRKAMGYEPGTPDLVGLRAGSVYLIELKRPRGEPDLLGHRKSRGELSPEQREWRQWAADHGFPWVVARSVAELEDAMVRWGLIGAP
jgi:hypothetical protein